MKKIFSFKTNYFLLFILSVIFASTIQQFPFFQGNSLHLLHSIKNFDFNKLENDWIANQTNHLPIFTFINYLWIKFFSIKFLYLVHYILLFSCPFFLFLICGHFYSNLNNLVAALFWFSAFTLIYHESSLFGGVAGQDLINEGYQPASFGVLFYIGIYFYLIKKNFLSIFFICLSASIHPTYVLHSGFLITGILIYYFLTKEYKLLTKIFILYSILIIPITIYILQNFILIASDTVLEGQKIMLSRIPHHADIDNWFSYKDVISIILYLISLLIVKKKLRIFIPILIFGSLSIILSVLQFFIDNNSLALAFPWRASVFLIPISTMIIFSFFINKYVKQNVNFKIIGILLLLISNLFFFTKNHFIENANKSFYKKLEVTNNIKNHYKNIERLLVPLDLTYIRMNTGLPIFVDWKHPPFKYSELINWETRIKLADKFYKSKNLKEQIDSFNKINDTEAITHILFYKNDFNKIKSNCFDLIEDKNFILIDAKKCYFDSSN